MNKAEFNMLAVSKGLAYAYFTAMRQGVSKAQAQLWTTPLAKGNAHFLAILYAL